jgi:3-dehydroquinate dehydratase II
LFIQVITGPNLNLLGTREPSIYGSETLADIIVRCRELAKELGAELDDFQSNHEGELVEKIQQCMGIKCDGILINPAAYGHTSIAMRDAFQAVRIPFVEVHLSNVHAREEFRRHSMLSDLASGIVIGFGADSYLLGLRGLIDKIQRQSATSNK